MTAPRAARRAFAATVLAALAFAACGDDSPPAAGGDSTLRSTLVDPDRDGFLDAGPAEPLTDRGTPSRLGETLVTFGQLTDTHVRDEESPARVPFLDRIGTPFTSTFRPQEAFSAQTLDAAIRALNAQRPDAVFLTGDITDNAQRNELELALATLEGGRVNPDSGGPGYRGVQQPDSADPFYYRPDFDAPAHPGALAQAQRAFTAEGLKAPLYPLVGNHDVLAQGEVQPTEQINAYATGDELITALDPELLDQLPRAEIDAQRATAALLGNQFFLPSVDVPADDTRRLVGSGEWERAFRRERFDYTVDLTDRVRAITVDTVNRDGTSRARINPDQLQRLDEQLDTDRHAIVFSHNPLTPEALQILDRHPNVVAAISGNSHRNRVTPRGRYWLVSTSSLADFPQQSRMFRLRETADGAALETWMVDHDGRGLAGISRELAFLDAQGGRPQRFAGERQDRNVRLFVNVS
ncbi:metallophosphoesterase [Solirubrobacter sp. CPCC 204708]|uniref:Metallophosphoesterase n=1 Tax=Solirubrobacter deserti TaxID=2282478 RepID=A0ABT4RJ07_9ACTN|nr:metallophosphoesterase [Solirubrobacter deserti]MBE2320863.1 metallophosphoesterase [Solirubrobacter deserti]MDA0138498.1 metallophosphoesterase [Solirubrobacter deserti]